ncbi:hypothetical protein MFFDBJGM_03559 [Pectobacterium versatile]|nr:hypothetical protein MFFDBJGM_03559 [Pectobacterium versatile]
MRDAHSLINIEWLSNPPKHKIDSILNFIRILAKIRDSLTSHLNSSVVISR